jgi:NAD(P)-dependent dehydrogenase (short-subunit alcohol dehydrogenase family)
MMTRVALIAGGTGALGSAVVAQLLKDGFTCHVTWMQPRELEHFTHADHVTLHQVDVSDDAQVQRLYAAFDRLDASVHVVGGFGMASVTETTLDDFTRMFQLNAVTAFLCTREAIRVMRRSQPGKIVNVAARPVMLPTGGMVAYSTSKAAVASLTQCVAEEVRGEGICVNAIVPSTMDTPANRASMPNADFSHWPKLEEVAHTIAFLVGAQNTLTTGTLVPVFGRI